MGKLSFVFILMTFPIILFSQERPAVTDELSIEVVTPSIARSQDVHDIAVKITVKDGQLVSMLMLGMEKSSANLMLVEAAIDSEEIWLIHADHQSGRSDVLAWSFNSNTGKLSIFPVTRRGSYILNVTIQASFESYPAPDAPQNDVIILEGIISGTTFTGNAAGRGNSINIE